MKGRFVFITGGAGFIGSHLIERLLNSNAKVFAIDNFEPFYPRALKEKNLSLFSKHPNFQFLEGNICSPTLYQDLEEKNITPDIVIHLAARAGVRPSIEHPLEYWETNIMGTARLFQWMKKLSKRPAAVFISSSSVYGDSQIMPLSETVPVDHPISPYAATKKAGELLCHTASHNEGFRTACLRLFSVYGPRQRPDLAIRKFAELISSNQKINLFGDGQSFRDYTYIDDIVTGIKSCAEYLLQQSQGYYDVFNLGGGHPLRLSEMVQLIEESLGIKAQIEWLPPQPGDVLGTFSDNSKAKAAFEYQPAISHREGFTKTIQWIQTENPTKNVTQHHGHQHYSPNT